jgi:hypothetical protein
MERLGVVKPHYDAAAAKKSWDEFKSSRGTTSSDREADADRGRRLKEYLLTIALEECLKRDMPMQIHSGDGEAPFSAAKPIPLATVMSSKTIRRGPVAVSRTLAPNNAASDLR